MVQIASEEMLVRAQKGGAWEANSFLYQGTSRNTSGKTAQEKKASTVGVVWMNASR